MSKWILGLLVCVLFISAVLWLRPPAPATHVQMAERARAKVKTTNVPQKDVKNGIEKNVSGATSVTRPDLAAPASNTIVFDRGPQRVRESETQFSWRQEFAQAFDWFCLASGIDSARRQRLLRTLAQTQQVYTHIEAQKPDVLASEEQQAAFMKWETATSMQLVEALQKELGTFLTPAEMSQWYYWMHTNVVVKMPYARPLHIPDGALEPFEP